MIGAWRDKAQRSMGGLDAKPGRRLEAIFTELALAI
jgi:hypothetical protein